MGIFPKGAGGATCKPSIRLKSSHDRPKQTKDIKKGNSSRKAKTWKDTSGFERGLHHLTGFGGGQF